jgi:hypothetical protein
LLFLFLVFFLMNSMYNYIFSIFLFARISTVETNIFMVF